jgi:hypothetical protein
VHLLFPDSKGFLVSHGKGNNILDLLKTMCVTVTNVFNVFFKYQLFTCYVVTLEHSNLWTNKVHQRKTLQNCGMYCMWIWIDYHCVRTKRRLSYRQIRRRLCRFARLPRSLPTTHDPELSGAVAAQPPKMAAINMQLPVAHADVHHWPASCRKRARKVRLRRLHTTKGWTVGFPSFWGARRAALLLKGERPEGKWSCAHKRGK